jgi:hypothetical protein
MGAVLLGLQQPIPFVDHLGAPAASDSSPGEVIDAGDGSAVGADNRAPGAITRGTRVGRDGLRGHG